MLPVRVATVPHLPPPTAGCHPAVPVVEKSVISGVAGETPGVHVGAAVVPPVVEAPPVAEDPPALVVPPVAEDPPAPVVPPDSEDPPAPADPPVAEEPPVADDPPVAEEPPESEDPPEAEEPPEAEDPPEAEEPPEADDPPVLAEPPVALFPPELGLPLEFELLQFAIAAVRAKKPIHAAIVGEVVAVFCIFLAPCKSLCRLRFDWLHSYQHCRPSTSWRDRRKGRCAKYDIDGPGRVRSQRHAVALRRIERAAAAEVVGLVAKLGRQLVGHAADIRADGRPRSAAEAARLTGQVQRGWQRLIRGGGLAGRDLLRVPVRLRREVVEVPPAQKRASYQRVELVRVGPYRSGVPVAEHVDGGDPHPTGAARAGVVVAGGADQRCVRDGGGLVAVLHARLAQYVADEVETLAHASHVGGGEVVPGTSGPVVGSGETVAVRKGPTPRPPPATLRPPRTSISGLCSRGHCRGAYA